MKNKKNILRIMAICLATFWWVWPTLHSQIGLILFIISYIGSPVVAFFIAKKNGEPNITQLVLLAFVLPGLGLPYIALQKEYKIRKLQNLKKDLKKIGASFNPTSSKKPKVLSMFDAGERRSKILKTPDIASLLPLAYKDEDDDIRYAAVEIIGKISGSDAVTLLESALNDPVGSIRQAAAKALDTLGERKPEKPIIKAPDYIKGLRPLGNKKRLTRTTGEDSYDVRLLLFRDKQSAEKYYHAFVGYAKNDPPPFLIEIMLLFIPKSIYAEKYAVVIPNQQTDIRPAYNPWAMNAIRSCNDTLRIHQSTDHKYEELHKYVDAVFKWDILVPKDFSETSDEAKELLRDDLNNCFPALKLLGQEGVAAPPEKPNPSGPWFGVLFEISKFEQALYGRAATTLLFEIAGQQYLAGSVIHGGDILPNCRYWCSAVHTASLQHLERIEQEVRASGDKHLASIESRFLKGSEVPVHTLPYQGFVSKDGKYMGI